MYPKSILAETKKGAKANPLAERSQASGTDSSLRARSSNSGIWPGAAVVLKQYILIFTQVSRSRTRFLEPFLYSLFQREGGAFGRVFQRASFGENSLSQFCLPA